MFIFKSDPNTPRNFKNIIITLLVAFAIFWVILYYLVPLIIGEPIHTLVQDGLVILAILFLIDLIWQ